MAATGDPWWINASAGSPAYSAVELRRLQAMLLTRGVTDRLGARPGVHPAGGPVVTLAGTTVTVTDHTAVLYPALTSTSGPYVTAVLQGTHALDPADASNPRKDIIILRVYDDDEDSSGQRTATSGYVAGTPAASPTRPATPSGAIRLATVDVPASGGGSPTLTYEAPYTVAAGGVVPVRDDAELPGSSGGLYDGMVRWRQDTNVLEVHNGSAAWEQVAMVSPPIARLRRTGAQSTTTGTDTTVSWDAEDYDTAGGHSTTTNPSRYTAQVSGYYRCRASIQWAGNTTGRRMGWLWLNGNSVVGSRDIRSPGTTESWAIAPEATIAMTAGVDYVEVRVAQTSGGNLDINGGTSQTASTFTIEYLRPL